MSYSVRYEKQLSDIKEKGYFVLSDGTRSDTLAPKQKKSGKAEKSPKTKGKRGSALDKSRDKSTQKKKGAKAGKTKKSQDENELDIESDKDSAVQESD